jgi:hypothetical protein
MTTGRERAPGESSGRGELAASLHRLGKADAVAAWTTSKFRMNRLVDTQRGSSGRGKWSEETHKAPYAGSA